MPQSVLLLDTTADRDGSVDVELEQIDFGHAADTRVAAPLARRLQLPADVIARRSVLLDAARAAQNQDPGRSTYIGHLDGDASALCVELAWEALHRWDFDHVVAPLLESSGERSFAAVLHRGLGDLPYFSVRASLREALVARKLTAERVRRWPGLPFWTGAALRRVLDHVDARGSLPEVFLPACTFLFAPDPRRWIDVSVAMGSIDDWQEVADESAGALTQLRAIEVVRDEIISTATSAGVKAVFPLSRNALLEHLGPATPGGTLFLLAHQERGSIELSDGWISVDELRYHLGDRNRRGLPSYAAVDLAVCGARGDRGLAAAFETSGALAVMVRGDFTFYLRALVHLRAVLRHALVCSCSLPALTDKVWLDELARATS